MRYQKRPANLISVLVLSVVVFIQGTNVVAEKPADYKSRNFLVHTDLSEAEANDLLKRLETMLVIISRYWAAPNKKKIELYVVDKLSNWPPNFFDPRVQPSLTNGAGITIAAGMRSGRRFTMDAIVYANATRGTPQHEAVHAYCFQTFGTTGPTWYAEGMADMGNYWIDGQTTVNCPPWVVDYLKKSLPRSVAEIVRDTKGTGDGWQKYARRWALCHMLAFNSNYADRFRPLGLSLLTQARGASFQRTYGTKMAELEFEYRYFLQNMNKGLDVDRIRWDWKTRFRPLSKSRSTLVSVKADRGWQAARIRVNPDATYSYTATGSWQLEKEGDELSADGNDQGNGRLMGIVLSPELTMSKPFPLGEEGTFSVPTAGRLYVRCKDKLTQLADNKGSVKLRLSLGD